MREWERRSNLFDPLVTASTERSDIFREPCGSSCFLHSQNSDILGNERRKLLCGERGNGK